MKKSVLHRGTSLVLALLMLCTSVGFSADLHFCKGELKSFSIFGEAESCHTAKKSCTHHAKMMISDNTEKDCCSNKTIEVEEFDTEFNVSLGVELTDIQLEFVRSFVFSFSSLSPPRVVKSTFYDTYDPLLPMDIYVLLERFLI